MALDQVFVANLSWTATEDDVRKVFEDAGYAVDAVKILTREDDGRSKGYGFVTLGPGATPEIVIARLHGQSFMKRDLVVEQAKGHSPRIPSR